MQLSSSESRFALSSSRCWWIATDLFSFLEKATSIEPKFKLSQNRAALDQGLVASNLANVGEDGVSSAMKRFCPLVKR